jgi:hypothetical protein
VSAKSEAAIDAGFKHIAIVGTWCRALTCRVVLYNERTYLSPFNEEFGVGCSTR